MLQVPGLQDSRCGHRAGARAARACQGGRRPGAGSTEEVPQSSGSDSVSECANPNPQILKP